MRIFAVVVALVVMSAIPGVGAKSPEMRHIMKPVNAVLDAITQQKAQQLHEAYTRDAIIIDNQAPYRWSDGNASSDWFSALTTFGKLHYARFTVLADPMNVEYATDRAYVTVLATLHGLGSRTGLSQNVLMTFTLRRAGRIWKITSQSWTTVPVPFKLSLK